MVPKVSLSDLERAIPFTALDFTVDLFDQQGKMTDRVKDQNLTKRDILLLYVCLLSYPTGEVHEGLMCRFRSIVDPRLISILKNKHDSIPMAMGGTSTSMRDPSHYVSKKGNIATKVDITTAEKKQVFQDMNPISGSMERQDIEMAGSALVSNITLMLSIRCPLTP